MEDKQISVLSVKISDFFLKEKQSLFSKDSNKGMRESKSTSSSTSTDERISNLPSISSMFSLGDIELPKIRQIGVKKSIDWLAQIFKCQNYQTNLIEFWFLDIITDFIWRIQDDFELPNDIQKITLSWLIFFINIIKDTEHNSSKDEVFEILKEAVVIAGKCMDEGDPLIPNPSKLVEFITPSANASSSSSIKTDQSKLSPKTSNDDYSVEYIEIEGKNEKKIYIISSSEESSLPSKGNLSMSSFSSGNDTDKNTNENLIANNVNFINTKVLELPDNKKKFSVTTEVDSEIIQNEEIAQKCEKAMQCLFDFVFEYFYNDFQFYIIKSVLTNPPKYKTEKLDINWQYPKTNKQAEAQELDVTVSLQIEDPFEIAKRKINDNKKYLFPLNN